MIDNVSVWSSISGFQTPGNGTDSVAASGLALMH